MLLHYSTSFEQVIVFWSMKESFCYYVAFEKVIRSYAAKICQCKFNTLMLGKKIFWRYYVDIELVNGHRVGRKSVHMFKFSAIEVTLNKKMTNQMKVSLSHCSADICFTKI